MILTYLCVLKYRLAGYTVSDYSLGCGIMGVFVSSFDCI